MSRARRRSSARAGLLTAMKPNDNWQESGLKHSSALAQSARTSPGKWPQAPVTFAKPNMPSQSPGLPDPRVEARQNRSAQFLQPWLQQREFRFATTATPGIG